MDILFSKRNKAQLKPKNCVARYLVIKHSWRGQYRRLLCISPSEIFTQDPAQSFRVTNTYSIGQDADIDGLTVGPGPDEFTLMARSDKKTRKFAPLKFSCKQRAQLLTDFYQCVLGVTSLANASLAYKLLSSAENFTASRWCSKQSCWQPATVHVSCFEIQVRHPETGAVIWRLHFTQLCSPAFSLLASGPASLTDPQAQVLRGVFGVHASHRRRPKLLACPQREALINSIQSQAVKKVGLELTVSTSLDSYTAQALVHGLDQAENQAASILCESPVAEWEVSRLKSRPDIQPCLAHLSTPLLLARPLTNGDMSTALRQDMDIAPGANLVSRRVVLTRSHLVERAGSTYRMTGCRPLAAVSALIRFTEDPQLLGIEWLDGAPASLYLTPSRDTIVAAILDVAQSASGTAVPVLPGMTAAGDDIGGVALPPPVPAYIPHTLIQQQQQQHIPSPGKSGLGNSVSDLSTSSTGMMMSLHSPVIIPSKTVGLLAGKGAGNAVGNAQLSDNAAAKECARWLCEELLGRARDALPVLNTSGRNFFTADIEFKPPAPLTAVTVDTPHVAIGDAAAAAETPQAALASVQSSASLEALATAATAVGADLAQGGSAGATTGNTPASGSLGKSTAAEVLSRAAAPPKPPPPGGKASVFAPDAPIHGVRSFTESSAVREAVEVVMETVVEFCTMVPYSGVPVPYKLDSTAAVALLALLPPELQPGIHTPAHLPADDVKQAVLVLQCLQRLASNYHSAHVLLSAPGALGRLWAACTCTHEHVAMEASRTMCRLLSPHTTRVGAVPWRALRGSLPLLGAPVSNASSIYEAADPALHSTTEDLELSKTAKSMLFLFNKLQQRTGQLLAPLHKERPPCSPLLSMAHVEVIATCVAEPGSATTDGFLMESLLTQCAAMGRPLFALFHHPAGRVADGVAVIMRAIAESGTAAAAPMREAALREGAMLHHLYLAVSPSTSGARMQLSRDLVASWADEYAPALTLLRRVFPPGMIRHINMPKPATHQHMLPVQPVAAQSQQQQQQQQPLVQSVGNGQPSPPQTQTISGSGPTATTGTGTDVKPAAAAVHPVHAVHSAASPVAVSKPASGTTAEGMPSGGGVTPSSTAVTGAAHAVQQQQEQSGQFVTPTTAATPNSVVQPGVPPAAAAETSHVPGQVTSASTPTTPAAVLQGGTQEAASQVAAHPQLLLASPTATGPTMNGVAAPGTPGAAATTTFVQPLSGGLRGNWEALWQAVGRDHCHAGLIWNESCRRELREALQAEESQLRARRQQVAFQSSAVPLTWNHAEFRVSYPSLDKHVCIGGIYIRLLLEGADTAAVRKVPSPRDLFQALHHYLLCSDSHLMHAHASSISRSTSAVGNANTARAAASAGRDVLSLQSSALSEVEAVQLLCVRGMTQVYHLHASAVGPLEGLPHLLSLLDLSLRRPLRHQLLKLVQAVLDPSCASTSAQAQKVARQNAVSFCDEGGVELLVDMVAAAHEASDGALASITGVAGGSTSVAPTATHSPSAALLHSSVAAATPLLTNAGHDSSPKEWYYYPNGVIRVPSSTIKETAHAAGDTNSGAPTNSVENSTDPDATGRMGPVSKAELLQLWKEGKLHGHTPCWAEGCDAPQPLLAIRELRWLVSGGQPAMSAKEMALIALKLIQHLADMQPATVVVNINNTTTTSNTTTGAPSALLDTTQQQQQQQLVGGGAGAGSAASASGPAGVSQEALLLQQQQQKDGQVVVSVLQPLPRVLRVLAAPRCLSHVAQALLTRDPDIVSQACKVLHLALEHNEDVLARLYRTGFFYFALSYSGSNLQQIAVLMGVSHLRQAHRGAGHQAAPGAPLASRSYLGHLLPESLLYCLDTYGPQAFATALSGDSDTPELRWTHAMRWGRLLPQLTAHLGDTAARLAQNWSGVRWSYSPAPPITYPDLKDEVWCHRYYLRSLCDEVRFGAWPVQDHIQLLQALLSEWRVELDRQPLSLSETEACAVLGLSPGPGGVVPEEDMRKAYRSLARKYHPDKNPEGRPMFLKIQQAYERLQVGVAGGQGPQMWRILLILKAQSILFRRFKDVLAPYKYAGYPKLLEVLAPLNTPVGYVPSSSTQPAAAGDASPAAAGNAIATPFSAAANNAGVASGGVFDESQSELAQVACELCWRTVCTSHLNADELARSGGVNIICSLFQKLCSSGGLLTTDNDISPTSHIATVATHLLRSIAGFAASNIARPQLLMMPDLVSDLIRCCRLTRAHAAAEAALVAVGHLCAVSQGQAALFAEDVLAHLIPVLFWYDATVEQSSTAQPVILPFCLETFVTPTAGTPSSTTTTVMPASPAGKSAGGAGAGAGVDGFGPMPTSAVVHSLSVLESSLVRSSEGQAHNLRAMMAVQVLARVAGVLPRPFPSPVHLGAQQSLACLLTPSLAVMIRDVDPRPLLRLLNSSSESAQVIWNSSMRDELLGFLATSRSTQSTDIIDGAVAAATSKYTAWQYSSLQGELQVGGVFVRVFCQQPQQLPQDVPGFCKALVRHLYETFVTNLNIQDVNKQPTRLMEASHAPQLEHVLCVLRALGILLDTETRLLGLLSSKSAVSPLVSALQVCQAYTFSVSDTHSPSHPSGGSAFSGSQLERTPSSTSISGGSALHSSTSLHDLQQGLGVTSTAHGSTAGGSVANTASNAATPDDRLCQGVLHVLSRLVCHAGCLEALSDLNTIRLLIHIVHCAPSQQVQVQALQVLRSLSGTPSAGVVSADQAGALLLLIVILHPADEPWPWQCRSDRSTKVLPGLDQINPAQAEAAALLSKLMSSPTHGTSIIMQLQRLLPAALVATLFNAEPTTILSTLRTKVSTPELVWDPSMAAQAAAQLAGLAHQARLQQATPGASPVWALPSGLALTYQQLDGEARVGGVYCRLFLKDPQYPLREPLKFGEGLAEALVACLTNMPATTANNTNSIQGSAGTSGAPHHLMHASASEQALLFSACAVALLKHNPLVGDTLAAQGYVPRLLALLAQRLPPAAAVASVDEPPAMPILQPQGTIDEGGALLRLLHALSASNSAAEAIAATAHVPAPAASTTSFAAHQGPVHMTALEVLYRSRQWGQAAEALVLETLKRVLNSGNRNKDLFVQQALQANIIESLLQELDWKHLSSRASQSQAAGGEGDITVLRALAVDVLTALSQDGLHAQQVQDKLSASSVWEAYSGQRHDLFLPTGAAAAGSVAGLLTGAGVATFALPAPERIHSSGGTQ